MKLLVVDCCISQRGEHSRTRALLRAYEEVFMKTHPHWEVERVDLTCLDLAPLGTAELDRRDALGRGGVSDAMFDAARQFAAADAVVVAAPYWDLSYPARLRVYIEHICANGVCYHYDEAGCHGDCRAQGLVYLTSGGDFEQKDSVGVMHFKQLCAMFGIPRFDDVFAGGLDIDPAKTADLLSAACRKAAELAGQT